MRKTDQAVEQVRAALAGWDEVVAVGLNRHGEDVYDPYYSHSFDVYTAAELRDAALRERSFGEVTLFESSTLTTKDRFLIGEIPVRIEYKTTRRFDELSAAARNGECGLRDAGTYAFRRVTDAEVLVSRGGWIEAIRHALSQLPDPFWAALRRAQEARVEHLYADLSAAATREDAFYFMMSAGAFLAQLGALLFTINRRFEPSPRALRDEVLRLTVIPDSFPANLENFVNQRHYLSMSQRRELAELMVTAVLAL